MHKAIMVNLLCLFSGMWRRRYMIAVPLVLMPIFGLLIGILSPKKFETSTTILIQEAAKQNPFLEDLTVETKLKERMAALRVLLHSRHILGPVGIQTGLINKEMSPEVIARKLAELSKRLRADLTGDDLVTLTYMADDPDRMAEVLHKVSVRFVERIIAPQRSSIANSEAFLEKEIKARRINLAATEKKLADYKSKHAAELPDLHANNVRRIQHLDELLAERRSELEGARGELNELIQRLASTNPVVGYIEEKIVEARSELAMLRARYTDRHTKVQVQIRHLQSLEDERLKSIQNTKPIAAGDLERLWNMATMVRGRGEDNGQPLLVSQLVRLQAAKNKVNSLTRVVAALSAERMALAGKISELGEHDRNLKELAREIDIRREIYEDLAKRHQLARVTGALGKAEEGERVKLIDPPFTPLAPSNLPLLIYIAAGLIGGIALGLGLALSAEVLDTSIYRRDVLERLVGATTLTRIPCLLLPGFSPDGGLDLSIPAALQGDEMEQQHA